MAIEVDRNHTIISYESSSIPTAPMGSPLRTVFNKIFGFATPSSNKNQSCPRTRRLFYRDAEQDDFQYANKPCLSPYYSVFVARLTIMAMLAILIGLLTILTWHFTRVYTTKSINSLAYGLRYELLQRPVLRMWNILNSTVEITTAQVKLSEYVIRRYNKPSSQAEQIELYEMMKDLTWALFASRKALNAITINYRNGFVQAFHRDHRSNSTFYIYSDLTNYSISGNYDTSLNSSHQEWNEKAIHGNLSAIWYHEPLNPVTGEKIGKSTQIPPDDLIKIAGLSQVPDGVASWHVVVSKYMDSPLLSAALPVWDPSNESIVAVVGVTAALYSVGQLMKELVDLHSGHMYLTSQEGYLLATSTNAPLLTNSTKGPKLRMAVDSEDPVIRSGAAWLQKEYDNKFLLNNEIHAERVKLGHQQYYIDSFFLNLKRLPMVGVIILPRKYIMGKIDERAFKTLVILISASLCILAIGCVCILILTNGVSKEMKLRAELISHLDARRRAEASSNYKSQFLANMSHELRTPMAAVIGLLDILICDDCLSNDQYTTVTQIRKCSTALLRLLNNILDLSKVESGKLVLEEAEFDLGRELEGLVDMFSVQCINHNLETILDLSDDMPKLVQGDSGRVVQIFANLISNSIKFTTSGHIILRGWCENRNTSNNTMISPINQNNSRAASKAMLKQHANHVKNSCKKENKIILWFEVDDTGCGIDPSKWESVFESFEQADLSTTRLHGGTGLGLCIVRTLVKQMGGEIKVVKKNGSGTLMQLYLLLGTPVDSTEGHCQVPFSEHDIVVLLALNGKMGRLIMSQWLQKNGIFTWEASGWNELTQILSEHLQYITVPKSGSIAPIVAYNAKTRTLQDTKNAIFIIVVDIGLLDLSTDIWKEQLNYLDKYIGKAKFAWMLNHDTSNAIKMELRRKGHLLMVNKPLYKVKMTQILEAFIKERNVEIENVSMNALIPATTDELSHECLEIDVIHPDAASSYDSDKSETESYDITNTFQNGEEQRERITIPCPALKNCLLELTQVNRKEDQHQTEKVKCKEQQLVSSSLEEQGTSYPSQAPNQQKSLEGLRILLAEDTPVLQRVATIMLEKLGATVTVVGDGLQAVDALKCTFIREEYSRESLMHDVTARYQTQIWDAPSYHLVLMDCQMPKMDGYEATKAIRKSEAGTGLHIPIVALTAHAMSSDEAKCLEVGMDAYLTKPIDCKLMASTILSLTQMDRLIS